MVVERDLSNLHSCEERFLRYAVLVFSSETSTPHYCDLVLLDLDKCLGGRIGPVDISTISCHPSNLTCL